MKDNDLIRKKIKFLARNLGTETDPLDADETQDYADVFKNELDYQNGNITLEEYQSNGGRLG